MSEFFKKYQPKVSEEVEFPLSGAKYSMKLPTKRDIDTIEKAVGGKGDIEHMVAAIMKYLCVDEELDSVPIGELAKDIADNWLFADQTFLITTYQRLVGVSQEIIDKVVDRNFQEMEKNSPTR